MKLDIMVDFAISLDRDSLIRDLKKTKYTKKNTVSVKDNRKLHNKRNLITETSWIFNKKLFIDIYTIQYLQKIYKR